MRVLINGMVENISTQITNVVQRNMPDNTTTPTDNNTARTHVFNYTFWGGQMHMLPEEWVLPHGMNLRACFGLWFLGIKSQNVPPIVFIRRPNEFAHLKEGKKGSVI